MRITSYSIIAFFLLLGLIPPGVRQPLAQAPTVAPDVIVNRPRKGEALQGVASIEGRIQGEGARGVRVSFTYAEGTPGNWFYISDLEIATEDETQEDFQVEWDTTKITDGNYDVRVSVDYRDGRQVSTTVSGLRIRNYSPVETVTSQPAGTAKPTAQLTVTAESTAAPTPSPLPSNPATLQVAELQGALLKGLGGVVGCFVLFGLYHWIRRRRQSF